MDISTILDDVVRANLDALAANEASDVPIHEEESKMSKYQGPKGLVTQRVLRGMIRAIARELAKDALTVREKLALLKQQERLAKQLHESAAAQ